jgi:hypothetical protein
MEEEDIPAFDELLIEDSEYQPQTIRNPDKKYKEGLDAIDKLYGKTGITKEEKKILDQRRKDYISDHYGKRQDNRDQRRTERASAKKEAAKSAKSSSKKGGRKTRKHGRKRTKKSRRGRRHKTRKFRR